MKLEVGQYVRLKNRTLQCPQIARIIKISKDSGYKNQYYIELDKNLIPSYEYHIYEEDISKASFKIIDLIEEGDYVNGREIIDIKMKCDKTIKCLITKGYDITNEMIKLIVTKEQFKSMEYIVKE